MNRRNARRRANRTGRSGPIDRRRGPKSGPKACGFVQFAWLPRELLEAPVWRRASINAQRVVSRVLLEHLHQGGAQNGELMVPHRQFVDYGVTPGAVKPAIDETVALGLLTVRAAGGDARNRRPPNLFTITWIGAWSETGEVVPPSNPWRGVDAERVAAIRAKKAAKRKRKPRAGS